MTKVTFDSFLDGAPVPDDQGSKFRCWLDGAAILETRDVSTEHRRETNVTFHRRNVNETP